MLANLVGVLRVQQWIKNAFIFLPVVFSGYLFQSDLWLNITLTFIAFSFISSAIYIINDLLDYRQDQKHPIKSLRPIAANKVSKPLAMIVSVVCLLLGIYFSYLVSLDLTFLSIAYVLLQLLYNSRSKKMVLVDVLSVAFGFLMRIWAGSIAAQVLPSAWLQLCVFVLSLFLGFAKRRSEMSLLKLDAHEHRSVLSKYSVYLLDQLIMICATLSIVFYGLYTISPEVVARVHSNAMLYSLPFVIYGIFRYLYLIHQNKKGDDSGEILLNDVPLFLAVLGWCLFVVFVIYFSKNGVFVF